MHINLTPEMEEFLQRKVETGFYSNASDVIRDAIRRMRAEDERLASIRAAIAVGDRQLDNGEGRPYTAESLDRITTNAITNAKKNKKVNPDVTP